jgi:soluble lytic murein transglycosylase-like protein
MPADFAFAPAPLFDQNVSGRAFAPTAFRKARARRRGPGRPPGRRDSALPWTAPASRARWMTVGALALTIATAPVFTEARAQDLAAPSRLAREDLITEAASRFAMPAAWIRAVMAVESAYDPRAVSKAGALGLMQIMPGTYADLKARYGLGADPSHPHDNVMAGAAYLRELYDRFGAPGFLGAYNAGPERYAQYLLWGRPLPPETRRYLAILAPKVTLPAAAISPGEPARPPSVFVRLGADPTGVAQPPHNLFVTLTRRGDPP